MVRAEFHVGPTFDVSISSALDVTSEKWVRWLLWLIDQKRVFLVHSRPPSASFLRTYKPRLRSEQCPWGVPGAADGIKISNSRFLIVFLVLLAVLRQGGSTGMTHMHPRTAYSWSCSQWQKYPAGRDLEFRFGCVHYCCFGGTSRRTAQMAALFFNQAAMYPCS